MAEGLRFLVADGNSADARRKQKAFYGRTYGEGYAEVLGALAPGSVVEICTPADDTAAPSALDQYDGVAITGSTLNAYDDTDDVRRQAEFARAVFRTGVPFFGSCWGLQIASVAAGGTVRRSPNGRELGLARKIRLTEAGIAHPMHAGKPPAFDAPAVHTDEVAALPSDITITATNGFSPVQAAEIRFEGGTFWGVQYHPEFTLDDLAMIIRRYGRTLVEEGPFRDMDELEAHAAELIALDRDPARRDLAFRFAVDADVLDPEIRLAEIRNWIECRVKPEAGRRVRA